MALDGETGQLQATAVLPLGNNAGTLSIGAWVVPRAGLDFSCTATFIEIIIHQNHVRQKWSFMFWPPYPHGMSFQCPLDREISGHQQQWRESPNNLIGNITLILPSRSLLRQSERTVLPFHLHLVSQNSYTYISIQNWLFKSGIELCRPHIRVV